MRENGWEGFGGKRGKGNTGESFTFFGRVYLKGVG